MSDGGKGSKPRPLSVTPEEFAANWDTIFGKKKTEQERVVEAARDENERMEMYERRGSQHLASDTAGNVYASDDGVIWATQRIYEGDKLVKEQIKSGPGEPWKDVQ